MADPPRSALEAAAALATARVSWVLLIDGRSGAGKSTLATSIAARTGAAIVRLDDAYPGWDGLADGAEAVRSDVLVPRRTGRPASYRRWDWQADRPAIRVPVPAAGGLVVEGCGVLTRRSAPLADLTFWVELDEDARRHRALARDGDLFAPHWDRWASQEARVIGAERPRALADRIVDGAAVRPAPGARAAGVHYRCRT